MAYCEFRDHLDDTIQDRLILGLIDPNLQRQLVAKPDLTLQTALDKARATESSNKSTAAIQKVSSPHHSHRMATIIRRAQGMKNRVMRMKKSTACAINGRKETLRQKKCSLFVPDVGVITLEQHVGSKTPSANDVNRRGTLQGSAMPPNQPYTTSGSVPPRWDPREHISRDRGREEIEPQKQEKPTK